MNSDALISLSPAQIYTVYAIAVVSCVDTFVSCLMRGIVASLATTLAPQGLMKAHWEIDDFQAMAQNRFHFSPEQI
jgi:hypothetical protein